MKLYLLEMLTAEIIKTLINLSLKRIILGIAGIKYQYVLRIAEGPTGLHIVRVSKNRNIWLCILYVGDVAL